MAYVRDVYSNSYINFKLNKKMKGCAFKSHQHKLIFTQTLQIPIELEREMALVRVRSVSWSRASSTHLSVLFVGFFFKFYLRTFRCAGRMHP